MRLTFIYPSIFVADFRRLGLDDEDLRALELAIMENPSMGRVIAGAGGLRKMRFSPPRWRRGKSGAMRVCYAYFLKYSNVMVLAAYAKNEQENISATDKARYRRLLAAVEAELSSKGRLI